MREVYFERGKLGLRPDRHAGELWIFGSSHASFGAPPSMCVLGSDAL